MNDFTNIKKEDLKNPITIKTYDIDDVRDLYTQVSNLLKQDNARILNAEVKFDTDFLGRVRKTVLFEIELWDD